MFQEIAVILIGIGVAIYLGWKIYRVFDTPRAPGSPCAGCKGCDLKNEIRRARKPVACPAAAADGSVRSNRPQPEKQKPCSCS